MENGKKRRVEKSKRDLHRCKFSPQMYRLLPKKDLEKIEEMALFFLEKSNKG